MLRIFWEYTNIYPKEMGASHYLLGKHGGRNAYLAADVGIFSITEKLFLFGFRGQKLLRAFN